MKKRNYDLFANTIPSEKIYLHLDRPGYMQGDTIWFKAYSWFGYEQIPDTFSLVLYVDLLNPKESVEQRRKLLIQNGTSKGEFILGKDMAPGIYTLRAYTRWMQNPGAGEPFYQRVNINPASQVFQFECNPVIIKQEGNDSLQVSFMFYEMDPGGDLRRDYNHLVRYSFEAGDQSLHSGQVVTFNTREQVLRWELPETAENDSMAIFNVSIHDEHINFEKQFRIPLREAVDLQFFPEGGNLVNGLESRVAFKVTGTDGLSREVEGEIRDADGMPVTSFKSSHKGMGIFNLKPDSGKKYFAHLEYNRRKYLYPLPAAMNEGCILSVNSAIQDNNLSVTINCNTSGSDSFKYIVCYAYGLIRYVSTVKISGHLSRVKIPVDLFLEGIVRITLLDRNYEPECERLVYVDKKQRFRVEIEPDSSSYGNRSKVSLLIRTTGTEGVPVETDLSLAVVDKEQIIKDRSIRGICAYKLLESELQGYIEDIDFYFKGDSITNRNALDLLLMTQGYRKFESLETSSDLPKFQPERGFEISGKIKLLGRQSRNENYSYRDIGLTLLCPSGQEPFLDLSGPDSLGHFNFFIPLIYGKNLSLLQALNPRGKPLYGEIFMYETDTLPRFMPPKPLITDIIPPAVEYVRRLQAVKRTEISKIASGIGMYLDLPEVTIKGRDKYYYLNFEEEALKIADMDSLDPGGNKFENIYDVLIREFGAERHRYQYWTYFNEQDSAFRTIETIFLPSIGDTDFYFPIYLLNGNIYFTAGEDKERFTGYLDNLNALNVNEIKKLMVLPPGRISNYYADPKIRFYPSHIQQSLVVMETYSKNIYRGDPQGIKTFILDGLDTPRTFYSPRYEGPSRESPIYDGRSTLFWEPSIRTDSSGIARIEFYTGDRQTEMEVIVNGIEVGSGNPGQGQLLISTSF